MRLITFSYFIFIYLLLGFIYNVPIQIFSIFSACLSFSYWFVAVPYVFWTLILCQAYVLHVVSSTDYLLFYSFNDAIWCTETFHFDVVKFINFYLCG